MSNEHKNILKFNNNKIVVNFQNIFVQNLVNDENNWTFSIDVSRRAYIVRNCIAIKLKILA